jgi:hypothetical protein
MTKGRKGDKGNQGNDANTGKSASSPKQRPRPADQHNDKRPTARQPRNLVASIAARLLKVALTPRFGDDHTKQLQWAAFLRKGRLAFDAKPELPDVLAVLRIFLLPPCAAIAAGQAFDSTWPPGEPWRPAP